MQLTEKILRRHTVDELLREMQEGGGEIMTLGVTRPRHVLVVVAVGNGADTLLEAVNAAHERNKGPHGWHITEGTPPPSPAPDNAPALGGGA